MRGAILHPLASITIEPQEWLNECNIRLQPVSSSFIEAGSFQSVCLDESVYFSKRDVFSSHNNCVLHKCSMKTQSYYPLPTKVEGYALAVYQSKVVLIGGNVPSQNQGRAMDDLKYPISVLEDDSGLEKRLKSALDRVPQESRHIYEIGKNAYAVGEGDLLIVIGDDGPHNDTPQLLSSNQEYVRVFNGQNWSYGIISITCTTRSSIDIRSMQKCLLVFQDRIYLTGYDGSYSRIFFFCTSLECFRNQLDPRAPLSWNQLEDVPNYVPCTNLSVLGNQLITVGIVDGGGFRMYAYLAKSSEWITVHEFHLSDVNSVPSITGIIGLQSSTDQVAEALLVGADHQLARICKLTTKCKLVHVCDAGNGL